MIDIGSIISTSGVAGLITFYSFTFMKEVFIHYMKNVEQQHTHIIESQAKILEIQKNIVEIIRGLKND